MAGQQVHLDVAHVSRECLAQTFELGFVPMAIATGAHAAGRIDDMVSRGHEVVATRRSPTKSRGADDRRGCRLGLASALS